MMRVLSIITLAVAPSIAVANCPVAADLQTGIVFGVDDGQSEVFRRIGPNRIEASFISDPTYTSQVILAHGVYVIQVRDYENGRPMFDAPTITRFPMSVARMPLPQADAVWNTTATYDDQGNIGTETHQYRFGSLTTVTYGDCTYDKIPVEIEYVVDGGGVDKEFVTYLPQLGLSYLDGYESPDGSGRYVYHSISAISK